MSWHWYHALYENDVFIVYYQQKAIGHDSVWKAPGEDLLFSLCTFFFLCYFSGPRSLFLNSSLLGPAPSRSPHLQSCTSPFPAPSHLFIIWIHSHTTRAASYPLYSFSSSLPFFPAHKLHQPISSSFFLDSLSFPSAFAPFCALLSSLVPPISMFPSASLLCLFQSCSLAALDLLKATIISLNSA